MQEYYPTEDEKQQIMNEIHIHSSRILKLELINSYLLVKSKNGIYYGWHIKN